MPFYEYRRLTPEEQQALVQQRLARGYPPHRTPHPEQGPRYYLITAAVYEHRPLIDPAPRRDQFQEALLAAYNHEEIDIIAWVILPNHYHILVWLPAVRVVAPIANRLHGRTSRQWNLEDNRVGRTVWYHYADRAIRNEAHFYRTINYIHANPVRHGYVKRLRDWPWSSLERYQQALSDEWLASMWRHYPITRDDEWDDPLS